MFQAVTNAFPSVDTFFLLSGCLLAYLALKELDKTKGRLNWIMLIVHRYLRYPGAR
jgi:peptidoglycan/LPS O-acetylase OafA/YrhL